MPADFSPFVYWSQTKDQVSLRIDLRDVKEPKIDLRKDKIIFEATGAGAQGQAVYRFQLDFYSNVLATKKRELITGRHIDLSITKAPSTDWWPRLTKTDKKLPWLKIDFDRWKSEDGDDNDDDDEDLNKYGDPWDKANRDQLKQLRESLGMDDSKGNAEREKILAGTASGLALKDTWLTVYSLFQLLSYLRVTALIVARIVTHREDAFAHMFDSIGTQIIISQCLAVLEVLHSLLGLVRSDVKATVAQVFGRNMVLFLLIYPEPRMQEKPVATILIFIWALSEICRYPYYMLVILKKEYYPVTWIRYSAWVPLYPLGFICEGVVMLRSLPYLVETGRYDLHLPALHITVQFHYLLMAYMLLLLPGGFVLMNHMYKQRKRKLLPTHRRKMDGKKEK